MRTRETALVVGASGALGAAVSQRMRSQGMRVLGVSRSSDDVNSRLGTTGDLPPELPRLHAVVWAQGLNVNDSAADFDDRELEVTLEANVAIIARHMRHLARQDLLHHGARLVVISSVWQDLSRAGKFSYTISKAALGGLVRAAAADLASRGVLVNAVLPGPVDTPMTRAVLDEAQLQALCAATGARRLVEADEVAAVVHWLASAENTAMTGQSVAVDLGLSSVLAI